MIFANSPGSAALLAVAFLPFVAIGVVQSLLVEARRPREERRYAWILIVFLCRHYWR